MRPCEPCCQSRYTGPWHLAHSQLRLIPRNLVTEIIHECLSIRGMVAIEASLIHAMRQMDFGVLCELGTSCVRRRVHAVALAAAVREFAHRVNRVLETAVGRASRPLPMQGSGQGPSPDSEKAKGHTQILPSARPKPRAQNGIVGSEAR